MPAFFKMLKLVKIHHKKIIGGITLLLFSANYLLWSQIFAISKKPDLEVYFFDVGQGDAELISTKDGTQILIDGGPSNKILSNLGAVLPYYDDSLDLIVLTHPHADHVSGLMEVLDRYKVAQVIESGALYSTAEAIQFEKILKEKNIKKIVADRPLKLTFYNGAEFNIIYPDESFSGEFLKNVHDSAVVGELSYENKKILFMSDAEKKLERKLVDSGKIDDVDVLKVGHHGSKTSSNEFFLRVVRPEYAIISSGARNRYGHPHTEVLSRLASVGATILRTDLDGTIKVEIKNGNLSITKTK